jgi:hypothetical protein
MKIRPILKEKVKSKIHINIYQKRQASRVLELNLKLSKAKTICLYQKINQNIIEVSISNIN